MKKIVHRAATRGYADHGWLRTHHTFSFDRYFDRSRMRFGALRVLNDDVIAPRGGFGMHPHDNMEIVTYPLSGELRHADSMGNAAVLRPGMVQVMSAGSGLTHSERNNRTDREAALLQIWVLTDAAGREPRYADVTLAEPEPDRLRLIVAGEGQGGPHVGWIHQDVRFHTLGMTGRTEVPYLLRQGDYGLYIFVMEGTVGVAGERLRRRDGMGIWETGGVLLRAEGPSELLLMEVPMG